MGYLVPPLDKTNPLRVATELRRSGFDIVDQSIRATHSASGATMRPQVGAVSDSRTANDPIRRHVPSRCSKNPAVAARG